VILEGLGDWSHHGRGPDEDGAVPRRRAAFPITGGPGVQGEKAGASQKAGYGPGDAFGLGFIRGVFPAEKAYFAAFSGGAYQIGAHKPAGSLENGPGAAETLEEFQTDGAGVIFGKTADEAFV
jgi:hypothetical protein